MANIEVMTPKTYSSYQLNTLCTVKFKINGTISCMSEKLTPRVSYKNSSGGFSHIIIQNLRCNSNGVSLLSTSSTVGCCSITSITFL